jgi:antirestriction protein ArdC
MAARGRGYASNLWASYRQWRELGAQVRRGERGSLVVFYKRTETAPTEPDDPDRSRRLRVFAKASWVFNLAQVDGYQPPAVPPLTPLEGCHEVEAFVEALCPMIQHGFARACYRRDTDTIEMPERHWFLEEADRPPLEGYYAVLLHELTHWSGAHHRLNRQFGQRFGDEAYAMEELVAELGAAFLCAAVGLSTEPRPDHAAYVASWLKVLGRDPRALFFVAGKAQEAAEFMTYLATGVIPKA